MYLNVIIVDNQQEASTNNNNGPADSSSLRQRRRREEEQQATTTTKKQINGVEMSGKAKGQPRHLPVGTVVLWRDFPSLKKLRQVA